MAPVVAINALLGWTLVGWVVALAMAVRSVPKPEPAAPPPPSRACPNGKQAMPRDEAGVPSLRQRVEAVGVSRRSLVVEGSI